MAHDKPDPSAVLSECHDRCRAQAAAHTDGGWISHHDSGTPNDGSVVRIGQGGQTSPGDDGRCIRDYLVAETAKASGALHRYERPEDGSGDECLNPGLFRVVGISGFMMDVL